MPASLSAPRAARACFAATALAALIGLTIQIALAASAEHGRFPTAAGRVFNVLCYFTIQSNVLVCVSCLLLAIRLERSSAAFAWLRMTGLVAIVVTGLVYYTVLADFSSVHGWRLVADVIVHGIVPVAAVAGWYMFGPRGLRAPHLVPLTLAFPACWLALTLIRGPIVDFYPYPFVDVDRHGYPVVLLNSAAIGALVLALAAAALRLDARLQRRAPQPSR
ncbi:MAG TPA: Pr6Pr family membrane protein [Conexibacter sp.]|nr:Pr6Pr family membrane protein [Conexibacter sp.]